MRRALLWTASATAFKTQSAPPIQTRTLRQATTIAGETAAVEYEVKKSRFVARAAPATTFEEAEAFIGRHADDKARQREEWQRDVAHRLAQWAEHEPSTLRVEHLRAATPLAHRDEVALPALEVHRVAAELQVQVVRATLRPAAGGGVQAARLRVQP